MPDSRTRSSGSDAAGPSDEASSDSQVFLARLNAGSDSALEQLFQDYFHKLTGLARRKMSRHVQADASSIAVSVLGSMARGFRERRFVVEDSRRLWNLLFTITLHKILARAAKGKREDSQPPDFDDVLARGPRVEDLGVVNDLIEETLKGLDASYRETLLQLLAGCTQTEIAQRLGVARAIIRAKISRLRDRLTRLLEESERK
jgi:DNA-directed RNA polymerase specialized sigma24 family protein